MRSHNICKDASHLRRGLTDRRKRTTNLIRRQCWSTQDTQRMCTRHGGLWFSIGNPPWTT